MSPCLASSMAGVVTRCHRRCISGFTWLVLTIATAHSRHNSEGVCVLLCVVFRPTRPHWIIVLLPGFAPLLRMMQELHLQKRLLCSCILLLCVCSAQRKVCPIVFQELDLELIELIWKNGASFCPF